MTDPVLLTPVGDGIMADDARWTFGDGVAEHFDGHVSKSIPLYQEGHDLVAQLSDFFVRPTSRVYEIGCSTATLTLALARRHSDPGIRFVAVDIEPAMAEVARQRCAADTRIAVLEADACTMGFERMEFAALYYTLQFMPQDRRQDLLGQLCAALPKGGGLVLFEKVRSPTPVLQDLMQQTYVEYKMGRGYSPHEIIGKSRSLKGVLDPLTSEKNTELLRAAGFSQVMTVQKYVCFEGFLAIK
ncbi:methyltransferase domain-containing protein [Actinacidiphila bryophytorum]|jgi:tRNA (cmo5U34)-methyltransferase|uniref:methyltransferase domain-containing protein n=1 Tax=Actinacidiphila bryophytorum TaxID=1436133 RepID=UPI002176BAD8|nr:methyltransferase domain-containing protein [Actinacidiphila bryophytorum]UWE11368.1 methyltransferase domain-containing protein [Actinacidiphila bryophytorum]